jgi:hypothetical protein
MDSAPAISRRRFVALAAPGTALAPFAWSSPRSHAQPPGGSHSDPWLGLKVGIAS